MVKAPRSIINKIFITLNTYRKPVTTIFRFRDQLAILSTKMRRS